MTAPWSVEVERRLRERPGPGNRTDQDRYYDGDAGDDEPAPWDSRGRGELDAEHWKKGGRRRG